MDVREIPEGPFRRHPWEVARFRFFSTMVTRARPVDVLDVGAGDGWFARELARKLPPGSRVTLWDKAYEGEHTERNLTFTSRQPTARFDVVLVMDMLEHVANDQAFLSEVVAQNLAPAGELLASVPAWPRLYGNHDLALLHHRRYSPRQLTRLLRGAGLQIMRQGGLFHSLIAARLLQNIVDELRRAPVPETPDAVWHGGPLGARLVGCMLAVDTAFSRLAAAAGLQVPGLTAWALCHR
jgi:SAM-dependent methyltransferase